MIPANEKKATDGYTNNGVAFSIDEEDMSFIFGILRNNMYSNPIKICVQEPLCNGRDAARAIGNVSKPMEVELPNVDFEYFTIRDFGPSLTYEQMVNVFCKYGKSTKRGTNQTGGFGIGAKSPWAYNNEFFVDTFIDNLKTSYRFYIDGETERGKMEVISSSKVETDNGLKVSIPVKEGDAKEFINCFEFVTRYWGVKPIIINDVEVEYINNEVEIEDDWILYKDRGAYNKAAILVDDIPYPIDLTAFEIPEHLENFVKLPIHFFCEADDVHVAASREQLNYTKKTCKFILSEFNRAYETCKNNIEADIVEFKTLPEAYVYWLSSDKSKWRKVFNPQWRNINLNFKHHLDNIPHVNNWRDGNEYTKIYSVQLEPYNTNGLCTDKKSGLSIINPILIIPRTSKRIPYARVRRALEALKEMGKGGKVTCVHFPDNDEREENVWTHLKEKCHWDHLEVYELDEFKKNDSSTKGSKKRTGNISEFTIGSTRLVKKFADIDSIEGYYCEGKYSGIDFLNEGYFHETSDISLANAVKRVIKVRNIYVIPKRYLKAAENNPRLTLIADAIKLNKKTVFNKKKCVKISKNIRYNNNSHIVTRMYCYLGEKIKNRIESLSPNSIIRNLYETYVTTKKVVSSEDIQYLKDMNLLYDYEAPDSIDSDASDDTNIIYEEIKKIKSKYPLLCKMDSYGITEKQLDHVILYINAVDSAG